jgi:LysR family hydrogen peroxide-inducible transcriptional activator
MELHQLRYFMAVAEERSFTRAADKVRVAQPSLSQQIQKLEQELGCPLFDRMSRGAVLTERGVEFLPFVRRALRELRDGQHAVSTRGDARGGTVSVGLLPTLAPFLLQHCVEELRSTHPQVLLQIRESFTHHLVQAVEEGDLDLAIVSTCDRSGSLERELLGEEPLVVVTHAGHPVVRRRRRDWKLLAAEPFLLLEETNCLHKQMRSWLTRLTPQPQVPEPFLQLATVLSMIRGGMGASLLPQTSVPSPLPEGLRVISPAPNRPTREINLLRNRSRHQTGAARAVVAAMHRAVQKMLLPSFEVAAPAIQRGALPEPSS